MVTCFFCVSSFLLSKRRKFQWLVIKYDFVVLLYELLMSHLAITFPSISIKRRGSVELRNTLGTTLLLHFYRILCRLPEKSKI